LSLYFNGAGKNQFGMVKEISGNGNTQVLSKTLDNTTDRITGPVKQFDMQQMTQEMQQHRQQPQHWLQSKP
jgi:hypothetical protein